MSSAMNLAYELYADARSIKAFPALAVGAVIGVVEIVSAILFGVLVFSGPLAPFVFQGIGIMVFGLFAACLTMALTSGCRGAVSSIPTVCVMVLTTIGAGIALEGTALFVTMVTIVIVSTVVTGVCFLAIGHFRLADLLRFVPYPVACGVLAGTGGLVFLAALSMMTATPDWQALPALLETAALWNCGERRVRHQV